MKRGCYQCIGQQAEQFVEWGLLGSVGCRGLCHLQCLDAEQQCGSSGPSALATTDPSHESWCSVDVKRL